VDVSMCWDIIDGAGISRTGPFPAAPSKARHP